MQQDSGKSGSKATANEEDGGGSSVRPDKSTGDLNQRCAIALTSDPARPAIEFNQQWFSWNDLNAVAEQLLALIEASGARPGDSIALIARNRPSAIAALLGLISHRHSVQMIYAFQSPTVIANDIQRLNPHLVIAASEDFTAPVLAMLQQLGSAGVALSEMNAEIVCGFDGGKYQSRQQDPSTENAGPHIEILTSGTTGAPKRFRVGYDMIAMLLGNQFATEQQKPVAIYFPLGNISGIFSTIPVMLAHQPIVLLERFTIPAWRDYVVRYQPVSGSMPPAGLAMLLDADIAAADLASIKYLFTGAAPLDPTVQRKFEQRYGIPVLLSYGATEFGGPVTFMTPELHAQWGESKFGSVGRPLPGAKLRVIDSETGAELPPGQQGILEVVSPRIGPQWLRTSDLAIIDADGFLFHCGRADSAIMRGGFKIVPDVIERALMTHPAISAAAAVGLPDARLGQVPGVAMELKPGVAEPSKESLEAHLRALLPSTHIPAIWKFVPALPRTPSMKVERAGLLSLFAEH